MAKHIGQIQGNYSTGYDLMNSIITNAKRKVAKVVKIGIQLEKARKILINQTLEFEMGKTGILEFEDVNIQHLHLLKTDEEKEENDSDTVILVPIIIDYVYEDED